ncbi:MAG: glycosyltransferase [Zoogloeaceae bacterium]|jgi:rhamnosyltransferase|nr:glycosyltransferase [Zoogloeaceae bacterium]
MKTAVLLATHNGLRWLPEQVDSILGQQGVSVRLFVSDDASTDGAPAWLLARAEQDERVTLLPQNGAYGSAAWNFYRLLRDADFLTTDYVAFSDQDDIWHPDKLARACRKLAETQADGYSSNVMAFWPDGRRQLVNKAQPQQKYDYLFEAAGPGCTYVMTSAFVHAVQCQLKNLIAMDAALPAHHDWFCYALCRMQGKRWVIDARPSMDYRQHGHNEVGVNDGIQAGRTRLRKVASGWYRREVLLLAHMGRSLRPDDSDLAALVFRLERGSWLDRLALVFSVCRLRRRLRDRLALAMLFLSGLFFRTKR